MSWKTITPKLASTRSEKLQLISGYFNSLEERSQILSKKLNYILSKVGDSDWLSKVTYTLDNTSHTLSLTGYTGSSRPDIPTFVTVNSTYYDVNKTNVKTVTISSNGGSDLPKTTFECISGCTLGSIFTGLGSPTKHDYVFDGWYTAASGGTAVTATTVVTSNMAIYAHWSYRPDIIYLEKPSFTYENNGGSSDWCVIAFNQPQITGDLSTAPLHISCNYTLNLHLDDGSYHNINKEWYVDAGRSVFQSSSQSYYTFYGTTYGKKPSSSLTTDSVTFSADGYRFEKRGAEGTAQGVQYVLIRN